MNNNKSRVVLVTGACGGIGRALVNKYANQGNTIAIADKSQDQAHFLADEIQKRGGKAAAFPGDLLDKNYCENLTKEVQIKLGAINILSLSNALRRADSTVVASGAWAKIKPRYCRPSGSGITFCPIGTVISTDSMHLTSLAGARPSIAQSVPSSDTGIIITPTAPGSLWYDKPRTPRA